MDRVGRAGAESPNTVGSFPIEASGALYNTACPGRTIAKDRRSVGIAPCSGLDQSDHADRGEGKAEGRARGTAPDSLLGN